MLFSCLQTHNPFIKENMTPTNVCDCLLISIQWHQSSNAKQAVDEYETILRECSIMFTT